MNKRTLKAISVIGLSSILLLQGCSNISNVWINKPIEVEASSHPEEGSTIQKPDVDPNGKDAVETIESLKESENVEDPVEASEKSTDGQDASNEKAPSTEDKKEEIHRNAELRATWISTVYNLDWPSKKGLTVEEQKKEFTTLLDGLKSAGLNAVMVQIKPSADSFYPSQYGPWSEYLTGVQGTDPGYNPLAFMIEETHKRDMEFHAWFNPYRVSVKSDRDALTEDHPAKKNPDWVVSYGGKLFYNPGIPAVQQFVIDSILEVVKNYNIDGVHLDDYFYPYPEKDVDFPDEELYQSHKRTANETKEQWRRNNINDFVKNLHQSIKREKNTVAFGVSPFGIWRNKVDDPKGSNTRGGVTSYDSLYADTKYWVENGWLDYIAPQIYWHIGYDRAEYKELINWWSNVVQNKKVDLYIGQAAYKVEAGNTPWGNPLEILDQIEYNRMIPEVKGSIFFRAKSIVNNPLGLKDNLEKMYKK